MANYPVTTFDAPVVIGLQNKTLITNFDDLGVETRKRKWLYPKRPITLKHSILSKSDARSIWQFYQARNGPHEVFSWTHPVSDSYSGEYVGTGDGSTTDWDIPSKTSSSRTIYLNGASQTEGTNYTYTAAGGADGVDKISFATAPPADQRITYDFTGFLRVRCRFVEDIASFNVFVAALGSVGIKLQGLLNDA